MPWGWKKDVVATALAHGRRRFVDERSSVDMKGHDHLKGTDMEFFRQRIVERANGKCELCGVTIRDNGELHHDPDGYERYDSDESVKFICGPCHRSKHVRVKLGTIPGINNG
jgi:hypothetical protein